MSKKPYDPVKQREVNRRARERYLERSVQGLVEIPETKWCSRCKQMCPEAVFHRRRDKPTGLADYCKACARTPAEKERNSQAAMEWARRNPERARANDMAYHRRNREKRNAQCRAYREAHNRSAVRAQEGPRRRGGLGQIDTELHYLYVLLADPCTYCGGVSDTIDHIVPVVRGGANDAENLTGACGYCNSRKATKSLLTHLMEV